MDYRVKMLAEGNKKPTFVIIKAPTKGEAALNAEMLNKSKRVKILSVEAA